jgi:hypothetical protein
VPIVLGDEDGAVVHRAFDLHERLGAGLRPDFFGCREQIRGGIRERLRSALVGQRRGDDGTVVLRENSRLDLRGDLGEIGKGLRRVHAGGSYHRRHP